VKAKVYPLFYSSLSAGIFNDKSLGSHYCYGTYYSTAVQLEHVTLKQLFKFC